VPSCVAIVAQEHRASAAVHSRVMANCTSLRFGGQLQADQVGLEFLKGLLCLRFPFPCHTALQQSVQRDGGRMVVRDITPIVFGSAKEGSESGHGCWRGHLYNGL
jgi:hypothetical protein